MAKSTVAQAAKDEKDIFELTSGPEFLSRFPAETSGLVGGVAKGGTSTSERYMSGSGSDDAGGGLSDWWNKDSTQEKFHGIMGALGATFGGMAGLPLGGGDTSSLERGAARAAMAPGQARQMIKERQFTRYIDNEIATATDPARKDMLMAVRNNPQQAAQYLAMESPSSKRSRDEDLENLKQINRMELQGLKNKGRDTFVTPNRADDIGTANQLFASLTQEQQETFRRTGRIPRVWMNNPGAINLIPRLFSPNGGVLGTNEIPNIDLSGTTTVIDPDTGEKTTVDWTDYWGAKVAAGWDTMTEAGRKWWDIILRKNEQETSDEATSARERAGLD